MTEEELDLKSIHDLDWDHFWAGISQALGYHGVDPAILFRCKREFYWWLEENKYLPDGTVKELVRLKQVKQDEPKGDS